MCSPALPGGQLAPVAGWLGDTACPVAARLSNTVLALGQLRHERSLLVLQVKLCSAATELFRPPPPSHLVAAFMTSPLRPNLNFTRPMKSKFCVRVSVLHRKTHNRFRCAA